MSRETAAIPFVSALAIAPLPVKAFASVFRGGLAAVLAAVAVLPGTAFAAELKAVTVVRGLVNPWALAFLPDGRMLFTPRSHFTPPPAYHPFVDRWVNHSS